MIDADEVYQMIVLHNMRRRTIKANRASLREQEMFAMWHEAWRQVGLTRLRELEGVTPLQRRPLTDI